MVLPTVRSRQNIRYCRACGAAQRISRALLGHESRDRRAKGASGEGLQLLPPSLLEPRRKVERALSAIVQEAYVHGVSTRKVDELVKALGMRGISKSRVSELCEELDEEVECFRSRPLEGSYPYVWVDATYLKACQDGRVVSTAVVIAVGVKAQSGEREVLGFEVGPSEDDASVAGYTTRTVRFVSGASISPEPAQSHCLDARSRQYQGYDSTASVGNTRLTPVPGRPVSLSPAVVVACLPTSRDLQVTRFGLHDPQSASVQRDPSEDRRHLPLLLFPGGLHLYRQAHRHLAPQDVVLTPMLGSGSIARF
jgi:hypothetical protein